MNRRGFFAALASLPFVPKALAAAPAVGLSLAKLARAKVLLCGFPDVRIAYYAELNRARRKAIDAAIIRAFEFKKP